MIKSASFGQSLPLKFQEIHYKEMLGCYRTWHHVKHATAKLERKKQNKTNTSKIHLIKRSSDPVEHPVNFPLLGSYVESGVSVSKAVCAGQASSPYVEIRVCLGVHIWKSWCWGKNVVGFQTVVRNVTGFRQRHWLSHVFSQVCEQELSGNYFWQNLLKLHNFLSDVTTTLFSSTADFFFSITR